MSHRRQWSHDTSITYLYLQSYFLSTKFNIDNDTDSDVISGYHAQSHTILSSRDNMDSNDK